MFIDGSRRIFAVEKRKREIVVHNGDCLSLSHMGDLTVNKLGPYLLSPRSYSFPPEERIL